MQGRILAEDLEELRRRADLVEVVSTHMQLKKAGRVLKGLCCFHQEKTPSFTVDPDKSLYHCFGCGRGGDVFSFVREVEGLSFAEAAERLAGRAGMSLRYAGRAARTDGVTRMAVLALNRAAAAYFSDLLFRSPEAAGARTYLERRGFSQEDAKAWGLGYAPAGKDGLYRHLLGLGFTSRQIVDGGLAVVTASGEHRDRFRGRVTFAISDVSGEVVGFGGRALADEQPKYLNSPETLVYHKGKILYGLDQAKAEMVRRGAAVVAEGYTDVIALHKFGATNAVATCGTALSEEHFATIKRFCDRAVLAFDADAAGAVASERGFGMHTRVGLEVLVAPIPPGKDPADVALGEGGEGVRSMLDHSVPLMLFVLKAELARHRLDTPEGKARAIRAAAALLAWEPSRVARGEHAFWLAEQVGVNPEHVLLELSDLGRVPERAGSPARPPRLPGHVRLEREALALLIDDTRRLEQADGGIGEEHFTEAQHRVVLRALVESAGDPAGGSMMDRLPDTESRRLASRLALAPKTTDEPDEVFRRLEELRLARKIDSFRSTLNQLDPSADTSRCDALFEELMRLEEQRRRFDER